MATLAQKLRWGKEGRGSAWPPGALHPPGCSLYVTLSVPLPVTPCPATTRKSACYSPINFSLNMAHYGFLSFPSQCSLNNYGLSLSASAPAPTNLTASFHVSQFQFLRKDQWAKLIFSNQAGLDSGAAWYPPAVAGKGRGSSEAGCGWPVLASLAVAIFGTRNVSDFVCS